LVYDILGRVEFSHYDDYKKIFRIRLKGETMDIVKKKRRSSMLMNPKKGKMIKKTTQSLIRNHFKSKTQVKKETEKNEKFLKEKEKEYLDRTNVWKEYDLREEEKQRGLVQKNYESLRYFIAEDGNLWNYIRWWTNPYVRRERLDFIKSMNEEE
jgi:hypothetical protein